MSNPEQSISLEVVLPLPRQQAFELVVERFAAWWPREYTFLGETLDDIGIEPRLGGQCYEQDRGGKRIVWGTVLSIEKPLYMRIAWQIAPDRQPVVDPAAASRVLMTFRDAGDATRLELVHTDFIRHGESANDYRAAMASPAGWPLCLSRLTAMASRR
ncbi:SRPBCC family protein [Pannonibacter sp. SL95]|uniref:SRPBCC family protein n=1 Tax=Pannonibacter sp. SL95 TaxID=2995153 RepID=UPI0022738FFB|nr:SRPBCC family protein [Pannonibacter sp. SL95]MCY1708163.1 SRPBCC family protein [Pannonibacter sp. SL95]